VETKSGTIASKVKNGRSSRTKKETQGMKMLTTMIAITLTAFTAKASEEVPYIALPVGIGHALDAKGARHPNAFCMRDAVFVPHPQYPYQSWSGDPLTWTRNLRGSGMYRLDLDLSTGRVSKITIIKSTGSSILDAASTKAFRLWVFKPGKWKEITIPTTVRTKWVGMTVISQ